MKRVQALVLVVSSLALTNASRAADPADVEICQSLFSEGRPGLYFLSPRNPPKLVSSSAIEYRPDGRFFFVATSLNGHTYRAKREMIWNVRLQTVAKSAKADETIAWRPSIKTECSNGLPLDSFGPNDRFVSLQRYYDHHASPKYRREDPDLRRKFHLNFTKSGGQPCQARTDAAQDVGDLRDTYGFSDVRPDALLLARITSVTPAIAESGPASEIYSGLSSELAHVSVGEPACFGFAAPLPTRSTRWTQIFPFTRDYEAQRQAQTWQPERTTVLVQRLAGRSGMQTSVRWHAATGDGIR